MANYVGTTGNDVLTGTNSADTFDISQGGNDTVTALGGNDVITVGAALTSADKIDGGTGGDTVQLDGDYSASVTFSATTMVNVETLALAAGHSYKLITNDATVASGQTLTVDGSALGAGDVLTFNGSAETDGRFVVNGGAGNDTIYGGAGNDTINGGSGNDTISLLKGGNDIANGGDGNDSFNLAAAFTSADRIDGGNGTDTVMLNGDYSAGLVFSATTMTNVEALYLNAGHSYKLITNDATVASGQTLTVNAATLGAGDVLTFNGSAETNGNFVVNSGSGNDTIYGGAGNDTINAGSGNDAISLLRGGNDTVHAGAGSDSIVMGATLTAADQIDGGVGGDTVSLAGDYSAGVIFTPTTMTNVEVLNLNGGFDYNLTINDATVAALGIFTVNANTFNPSDTLTFDGSAETDGRLAFNCGPGTFILTGGAGKDSFAMGASFTSADRIDGGAGSDTLTLNGNYSAGLTLGATTLTNVETMSLTTGHSYNLTTNDANVAAGQTLTIGANTLGTGDTLTFNGSAETDGSFYIKAGAGLNTLTGGAGNDTFSFSATGPGSHYLTSADHLDGGAGNDTLFLEGNYYTSGLTFSATTMINVENIVLGGTSDAYKLTTNDATVAAGQTLTVDASKALSVQFNGSAETDGHFIFICQIASSFTGGALSDTFVYNSASVSSTIQFDTISSFDFSSDRFDTPGGPGTITAIDPAVTTGWLDYSNLDADLSTALNGQLNANHAILFTPNNGGDAGQTYLIVDLNGIAGYQANGDLVIHLIGATGTLATSDFI